MLEKNSSSENKENKSAFSPIGIFIFCLVFISPLLAMLAASLIDEENNAKEAIHYAETIDSLISDYEKCIPDKKIGLFLFKGISCKNKIDALEEAARNISALNEPSTFPNKGKTPDAYAKAQESIKKAISKLVKYKHYDLAFGSLYASIKNIDPQEMAPEINEILKKDNVLKSEKRYESLIDYRPTSVIYYLSHTGLNYEKYAFSASLANEKLNDPSVLSHLASSITQTLLSFGCKDDFISWSNYFVRVSSLEFYENQGFVKYYLDSIKDIDSEKMDSINKNTSWLIENKKVPSLSASCELKPSKNFIVSI